MITRIYWTTTSRLRCMDLCFLPTTLKPSFLIHASGTRLFSSGRSSCPAHWSGTTASASASTSYGGTLATEVPSTSSSASLWPKTATSTQRCSVTQQARVPMTTRTSNACGTTSRASAHVRTSFPHQASRRLIPDQTHLTSRNSMTAGDHEPDAAGSTGWRALPHHDPARSETEPPPENDCPTSGAGLWALNGAVRRVIACDFALFVVWRRLR